MKKILIIAFLILPLFVAAELELNYPTVGEVNPDINTGLPEYISYIFSLSLMVLGIILFGVLVYNGIKYITSAGDPGAISKAKNGIKSGFVGAIILLSTFLVLNTINPNLVILSLEDVREIETLPLTEGVYVCNFKIDNISQIINKYENSSTRDEAIHEFYEAIKNSEAGKSCARVTHSSNVRLNSDDMTYFVIPDTDRSYNYTAIFYKQENGFDTAKTSSGAQCEIVTTPPKNDPSKYHQPFDMSITSSTPHTGSPYTDTESNYAFSISPIKFGDEVKSVTFYEGYDYNNEGHPLNSEYRHEEDKSMAERTKSVSSTIPIPIRILEGYNEDEDSWFEDFYCRESTLGNLKTCGVRSAKIDNNVFLVFTNTQQISECYIIEQNTSALDSIIPTIKTRTFVDQITGFTPRGFDKSINFEKVVVINGNIQ